MRRLISAAALLLTALLLLTLCAGGREQQALARQVVRLHVLANSDSEEDQALKLAVRDGILARAEPLLEDVHSPQEAQEVLRAHQEELRQAGQQVVLNRGRGDSVRVRLTEGWYPTRRYTDFALPAGRYASLRVEIGRGEGRNWWCVVYPPLCSVGIEEAEPAALGLNPDQIGLIREENRQYVIRFRCMELWGAVERWLS